MRRNQLGAGVQYKTDPLFQRAFLLLLLRVYVHILIPHFDHLHLHILINSIFFNHAVFSLSPHAALLLHIIFPCHLLITLSLPFPLFIITLLLLCDITLHLLCLILLHCLVSFFLLPSSYTFLLSRHSLSLLLSILFSPSRLLPNTHTSAE